MEPSGLAKVGESQAGRLKFGDGFIPEGEFLGALES
jgi:hypothetical protein